MRHEEVASVLWATLTVCVYHEAQCQFTMLHWPYEPDAMCQYIHTQYICMDEWDRYPHSKCHYNQSFMSTGLCYLINLIFVQWLQ